MQLKMAGGSEFQVRGAAVLNDRNISSIRSIPKPAVKSRNDLSVDEE